MKNEKTLSAQVLHWFECYLEGFYASNSVLLAEAKRTIGLFLKSEFCKDVEALIFKSETIVEVEDVK